MIQTDCPFCDCDETFIDGNFPDLYVACPACQARGPVVSALPYDTPESLEQRAWDAFSITVTIRLGRHWRGVARNRGDGREYQEGHKVDTR